MLALYVHILPLGAETKLVSVASLRCCSSSVVSPSPEVLGVGTEPTEVILFALIFLLCGRREKPIILTESIISEFIFLLSERKWKSYIRRKLLEYGLKGLHKIQICNRLVYCGE